MELFRSAVTTQRTSKPFKAQLFLSLFLVFFGGMSWLLPYGHTSSIGGMPGGAGSEET